MTVEDVVIDTFAAADQSEVKQMIKRNLEQFQEAGSVISSTFRRLENLLATYSCEGSRYFVCKDKKSGRPIAGAGLGPLHGLPVSEGVAEIRDLVVEPGFRGQGIGAKLLNRCIKEAKEIGYKRLYLETTPQMEKAQKLFLRRGFRPVTEGQANDSKEAGIACYFVMEEI